MTSQTRGVDKLRAIEHHILPPMLTDLVARLFGRAKIKNEPKVTEILLDDPLDPRLKHRPWKEENGKDRAIRLLSVEDFPVFDGLADIGRLAPGRGADSAGTALTLYNTAKDGSAIALHKAMDDSEGTGMLKQGGLAEYQVPFNLQAWYASQGFIGYQACAIIAQHWLVDKACSMAGEDAVRNGWVIKARGGKDLKDDEHNQIIESDKAFKVKENLIELNRFKNVFGIRIAIFKVKSEDKDYYTNPFNIDGVTEGSYEGISQVDPYWMMPVMTTKGTSDPSAIGFYDPEYWTINGVKYHKSHLIIVRGPQPADILKPTYIFGGIPLTQRIYERVYAAERTANEAPLMAMSKRTMAIHADLDKVMADQEGFEKRLMTWIRYRDNHGVKVLGKEEAMEQFDTNMSDFDSIIMNQYQLVAAIARVPSTKLLGTSPKGFNATGEFEMKSYHEELESIQEHTMMPLLERHYDIMVKHLGLASLVECVCNSVDSLTAKERAEINDMKVKTGESLITSGVISPDQELSRLRDDEHSGYNRLEDQSANQEAGMSPENIAALQKAGAAETKAGAESTEASAGAVATKPGEPGSEEGSRTDTTEGVGSPAGGAMGAAIPVILKALLENRKASPEASAAAILALVNMVANQPKEGVDLDPTDPPIRGTKPGTRGLDPTVGGVHSVVGSVEDWAPAKLPKMRVSGLVIDIENPRGTIRKGFDEDGVQWRNKMPHHYGYIRGYQGADEDEVDCFVGTNLKAADVYVIAQNGKSGEFDEYKCMLGFDDETAAREAYDGSYRPGWDGFGSMTKMSMDEFKAWLESGDCAFPPKGA